MTIDLSSRAIDREPASRGEAVPDTAMGREVNAGNAIGKGLVKPEKWTSSVISHNDRHRVTQPT
ncbi:hypothetical protein, partial [Nocardia farcinica]|uniref:hypothetical protein n=1 Tax=Nocardia farcinica TaxID=37329 RepID=UPI002454D77E